MKAAGEGPNCETSMGPQGPKSDCDSLSVVRPEKSHQGSRLLSVPCILPQVPVVRGRAGPQTDLKLLTIPEACSPSPCLSPNFLISGTSGRQRSSGSLQGSPHGPPAPPPSPAGRWEPSLVRQSLRRQQPKWKDVISKLWQTNPLVFVRGAWVTLSRQLRKEQRSQKPQGRMGKNACAALSKCGMEMSAPDICLCWAEDKPGRACPGPRGCWSLPVQREGRLVMALLDFPGS